MQRSVALVLTLLLTAPAAAFDAEAHARAVAPFLDEQAIAIAHIDLTRVDTDKLAARLGAVSKVEARDLEAIVGPAQALVPALSRAGGKDLYLIVSLADLPVEPALVVVPLPAGADAKAVTATLEGTKRFAKVQTQGQAVVAGGERSLQRLRDLKPAARPELARAFAGAGDAAAQLVVLPSPDLRRAFEEAMPSLPKEIGGGPTRVFTRGLVWMAVAADLAPQPSVRLVVQSPDAASAKALREALAAALKVLGSLKEARELYPDLEKVLPLLTPAVTEDRLTLTLGEKELASVLQPLLAELRGAAGRRQASNSLKQIGRAMHNHADARRASLPPAASRDKQGKPLLSWRVHLLPFLGEEQLYKQFKLDEPWDSPHNVKLLEKMPSVYQIPSRPTEKPGLTYFQVFVNPPHVRYDPAKCAPFGGPKPPMMPASFPDGTSNTILVAEAAEAVPWTKPADIPYDPNGPLPRLGNPTPGGFSVVLADGSVRFIKKTISEQTLRSVITPADGRVLGNDW